MEREQKVGIWKGIGLLALGHAIFTLITIRWQPMLPLLLGVTQLIYAIPISLVVMKKPGWSQGVWIGVGITFLLNAACFGIGFGVVMSGH